MTYLTRSCYCYGYIGFMVCGAVLYFFLIVESGGAVFKHETIYGLRFGFGVNNICCGGVFCAGREEGG